MSAQVPGGFAVPTRTSAAASRVLTRAMVTWAHVAVWGCCKLQYTHAMLLELGRP